MSKLIAIRGQHVRETLPNAVPADSSNASAATAANAVAAVALAADTSRGHIVSQLWWSYSGGSVSGNLTITDGTNAPINIDIAQQGPGLLTFTPPLIFASSAAVTATLAAGGTGVTGKVGMNAYRLQ